MAKTDKKQPRPRAEPPRGFRDTFDAELRERKAMLDTIAAVYRRYGFDALESAAVETVEALGKFLPDVDRPNEGVFAWQEEGDGPWLALRYDLTAPLARVYAQHRADLPTPYRRYAMGPVWRNEKPGPGRFRQFTQCDADTVGAPSVAADAEMCMMLADTLEAVGIARGDYVVRVNNRKVLNGVLEVAGRFGALTTAQSGTVLRAIDKIDRLGWQGVSELLSEGRRDDSGDFTPGARLRDEQSAPIMQFVRANDIVDMRLNSTATVKQAIQFGSGLHELEMLAVSDPGRIDSKPSVDARRELNSLRLAYLREIVGNNPTGEEGVAELETIADILEAQGYGPERILIDPSVVRGLGYYTGPVFEAELTFEILGDDGQPRQFGSVAGGGRYDDLVKRFTGQAVPATGVSIGVDRLLAALATRRAAPADPGPVVVTVMDRHRMADYLAMATDLRQAGIRAEVYLGNPKNFGNQMKYADKRGSPLAIIQGADEHARGVVQIKDLILGAKIAENASLEEWKANPAQREAPRADLVATVRRMLGDA